MENAFSRTGLLLGNRALEALAASRVAVFGVGGVGGYAVEALARSGVGSITVVDNDIVSITNLNRQLLATLDTLGRSKAEVAAERIKAINPMCRVTALKTFYLPGNYDIDFNSFDYIVDAIDTISGKIAIIENAYGAGVPVISCMGAGNKLDPAAFEVADIYSTSVCPLARVMRRELRRRGIPALKVVYSREQPVTPDICGGEGEAVPGSVAFVPSVAGLIAAGEAVKDLIKQASK